MTGVTVSVAEALRPWVEGNGVQCFPPGEAPFQGVPVQTGSIAAPDGSLDFVVAGPDWWTGEDPVALAHEWRRCLREGGRLAVLVAAASGAPAAIMRFLAVECGLEMERPAATGDGSFVLSGVRDAAGALRRHFAQIGFEVGRRDLPDRWRREFWLDLAAVLLQAGEGRRAAECFGVVASEDPTSLEARVGIALSMAVLAEADEAEAILGEVLRVDPDQGSAADWVRRCRARREPESGDRSVLTPAPPKNARRGPVPR